MIGLRWRSTEYRVPSTEQIAQYLQLGTRD